MLRSLFAPTGRRLRARIDQDRHADHRHPRQHEPGQAAAAAGQRGRRGPARVVPRASDPPGPVARRWLWHSTRQRARRDALRRRLQGWVEGIVRAPPSNAQNATVSGAHAQATTYNFPLAACNGNVCSAVVVHDGHDARYAAVHAEQSLRVTKRTFASKSRSRGGTLANKTTSCSTSRSARMRRRIRAADPADVPTGSPRRDVGQTVEPGTGHSFYISACNQFCSNESPPCDAVTHRALGQPTCNFVSHSWSYF